VDFEKDIIKPTSAQSLLRYSVLPFGNLLCFPYNGKTVIREMKNILKHFSKELKTGLLYSIKTAVSHL